jgi:hypothetical protein
MLDGVIMGGTVGHCTSRLLCGSGASFGFDACHCFVGRVRRRGLPVTGSLTQIPRVVK